ncbi:MAG: hypothetical protein GY856_37660, partial [bacterium]|nr:hypothetical protein [bacterium]
MFLVEVEAGLPDGGEAVEAEALAAVGNDVGQARPGQRRHLQPVDSPVLGGLTLAVLVADDPAVQVLELVEDLDDADVVE